jgi:phosphatidylglycerol:prolipoprotein diacylglycerol transferase
VQLLHLLSITISWDPNIAEFGSLQLTWHGIFTAIGIAAGVYLGAYLGRREGFTEDDAYSIALVGVPCGIIGARALYVLENQERFHGQWLDVLKVNEGGISIYGAVIGGVLGAVVYGWFRKMPILRGLDAAGFGLLLGMAIGRIGDIINGEHVAKTTDLPWGVIYTHPDSPSWGVWGSTTASHPATAYELIGDLLIMGIMWIIFTRVWRHWPGVTFFTGLVLYSAMRFGVSYLRIDSGINCPNSVGCPEYVIKNWMTFPQVVSTITFFIGVAGLAWTILRGPQPGPTDRELAQTAPDKGADRRATTARSST